MGKFIYRTYPAYEAHRIMDWCEDNKVEYDIWNAGDLLLDPKGEMEIGLSEHDYQTYCLQGEYHG